MRRHLALAAFASLVPFWMSGVRAAEIDPSSASAIQAVISSQIEAFGRDDAVKAQSFASPGIQQRFPDPNQFLGMVKQSYGALVHPRSTHFEPIDSSAAGPMQKVTVVDSNGVAWTAVYMLEQVDGQWRITGCSLLKAPDVSA